MVKIIIVLGFTALMLGFSSSGNAHPADRREDEKAIKAVVVAMTEGFNRHDAKAATRMYTPDADFVNVRGDRAKGRKEIEDQLAAVFASRLKESILKTESISIRFVRTDVAIVHVVNERSGLIGAHGVHWPPQRELSIRVMEKDGGAWRVTAFHNTMIRPFDGSKPD